MASSSSSPPPATNSWLFDLDLVDDSSHHLLWDTSVSNDDDLHRSSLSLEHEISQEESLNQDKSCSRISESDQDKDSSRKRSRRDSVHGVGNKACREKVRRDRLNDRFMELSALLEPCKTPKTDKGSILRDATRILGQMRVEMQQLKEANNRLQEAIKELKAEKNELRDEKCTLKLEKERLENHLKTMNVLPGYVSHLQRIHPTSHASVSHLPSMIPSTQSHLPSKPAFLDTPFASAMTQWIPSSIVDISNDHILRPPVA